MHLCPDLYAGYHVISLTTHTYLFFLCSTTLGLSDVFSKHSTPEEWENRGQYFLENNVYNMAAESFRRVSAK